MSHYGYDGMVVCCPECGTPVLIDNDAARCTFCEWFAADSDLEEIMAITPEEERRNSILAKFALMIIALMIFITMLMFAYFQGVAYAITNTDVTYRAGEVTLSLYGQSYVHQASDWHESAVRYTQ